MGLTITSNIVTSNGACNTTYINISEYYVNKQGNAQFPVRTYQSKTDRDTNPDQTVQTFAIANRYDFNLTVEELEAANIYTVAYNKIKSLLESQGHTVTDSLINTVAVVVEEEVIEEVIEEVVEEDVVEEVVYSKPIIND